MEKIDFTQSSDSTSRRKINYQAQHIHVRVPEIRPDGSVGLSSEPKTMFCGVTHTNDHSVDLSKESWLSIYDRWVTSYKKFPLAKLTGELDLAKIATSLRGMCGDHANNEKALAEAQSKLKDNKAPLPSDKQVRILHSTERLSADLKKKQELGELEEMIQCEICTMKMWSPAT